MSAAIGSYSVVRQDVTTKFGKALDGVEPNQPVGEVAVEKQRLSAEDANAQAAQLQKQWDRFADGGAVRTPRFGVKSPGGTITWLQVQSSGYPSRSGHSL